MMNNQAVFIGKMRFEVSNAGICGVVVNDDDLSRLL
jgi:hypothetical protein